MVRAATANGGDAAATDFARSARFRSTLAALTLLAAVGCGAGPGEPCATSGSGFTASDPCRSKCLDRWGIECPGGETIHPGLCAGREGCEPGACPDDQICYRFNDPFENRTFCIPRTVCPDAPADEDGRRRWEELSIERAEKTRAEYERRKGAPQRDPDPAPQTTPVKP